MEMLWLGFWGDLLAYIYSIYHTAAYCSSRVALNDL